MSHDGIIFYLGTPFTYHEFLGIRDHCRGFEVGPMEGDVGLNWESDRRPHFCLAHCVSCGVKTHSTLHLGDS